MKGKLRKLAVFSFVLALSALISLPLKRRSPVQLLPAPSLTRRAARFPVPKSPPEMWPRVYPLTPQPMLRAYLTS